MTRFHFAPGLSESWSDHDRKDFTGNGWRKPIVV